MFSRVKNKRSLTMIELMMVAVMITVLASVATARYFKTVEKSRGIQAMEVLTRIYRGYKIRQIDEQPTTGINWAELGFDDNTTLETKYFDFAYNPGLNPPTAVATRKGVASQSITINLDDGSTTKTSWY